MPEIETQKGVAVKLLIALLLLVVWAEAAPGQRQPPQRGAPGPLQSPANIQTLYNFGSQSGDGLNPVAGLIMDTQGNLYGTTVGGGSGPAGSCPKTDGCGTVFQLSPGSGGWTEKVVYNFCPLNGCADGANPKAGLIIDAQGNLYGTTAAGGNTSNAGVVFGLMPGSTGWTEKVLYTFCSEDNCQDGANPLAGLTMDAKGNLYGTTELGSVDSSNAGLVFELIRGSTGWTEKVLYRFCSSQFGCDDGANPKAGLIFDPQGNLYGTTELGGGSLNGGVVFELMPGSTGWTQKILHWFCSDNYPFSCTDGSNPVAGPIMDMAGNLWAPAYGGAGGRGTVISITPGEQLSIFIGENVIGPAAGLTADAAGNLYGTSRNGGSDNLGTVFTIMPTSAGYSEKVVHSFAGGMADGLYPLAGLTMDAAGNLYGTTSQGGARGGGIVFMVSASSNLTVSVSGNGTVTSAPAGIDCPTTCSASFAPGTQVTLTATSARGSIFTGWGSGCSGTGNCTVTMNSGISVTASFSSSSYSLSVSVVGSPGGNVTSSPSGINCGSTCSANFNAGTQVTLTANAAAAWGLAGWGGACSGIASSCTVTMGANTSLAATFATLFTGAELPVATSPTDIAVLLPPALSPVPQ